MNVPKAPSNDALIFHAPNHIEGIQYKSSDNIRRGLPPSMEATAVLKLGTKTDRKRKKGSKPTIWSEFNKVTDDAHKKFYGERKFTLVIISNKVLDNYEAIKHAVATNKDENGLPRGVILVCHQNFKQYAGSLAHQGLFIPLEDQKIKLV